MLKIERAKVIKLEGELASLNAHIEGIITLKHDNEKNDEVKNYQ